MLPKVAIIYLTFPTPEWKRDIDRCMKSLESLDYPKEQVELICVESKYKEEHVKEWFDATWMPKSGGALPRITYVYSEQPQGFSGNNNLGFAKAKELGCAYVYLLNEDTEVDAGFLKAAVVRAETDPRVALVQSFILLGQDRNKVNSMGNAYHFLGFGYSNGYLQTREECSNILKNVRMKNPDLEIGYASGAGVLARVSAVDACGGLFDEQFFSYHEDTDLSLRARICGFKVVVEPMSIIYHYYEVAKTQLKKNFWIERNRLALLLSFYRLWTLILVLPMWAGMEVAQFAFALYGGWWREKVQVYKEVTSSTFWHWIGTRLKKIQTMRKVSDRALLKYAVTTIEFQGEGVKNPVLTWIGNPLMKAYWTVVRFLVI